MKRKFLLQKAAVLAAFAVSCGACCLFFSGINIFEGGLADRLISAVSESETTVIVIDPGHGGMDGGASSPDGVQEKDINLAIAMELAETARSWGAEVIMTRDRDEGLYTDDGRTIREKKRENISKYRISQNSEKKKLTFIPEYDIKIWRFEDIVLQTKEKVKII